MSKITRTLTLPDGRRKYFRGDTVEEAERLRDEAKLQLNMGIQIDDSTTVAELAGLWFSAYKKGQMHIRSEETIQGTLKRYVLPALGHMPVKDVKPIHIQMTMARYSKYSKSTQKKILQAIKSMFEMAEDNGLILRTPVSNSIKAKGENPAEETPLTYEQSDALLAALDGTRAHLLVLVLLYAGLRIGEALGLKWGDIDYAAGRLTVNRSIVFPEDNQAGVINEELKTSAAHRSVDLPWFVVKELESEMARSNSVWVFAMRNGEHLSYSSFRSLWKLIDYRTVGAVKGNREITKRTLDFKVHPHLLRHTCVTRWFEQGLDITTVQHLAGHSDPKVTLKVYNHYMEAHRAEETARLIRETAHVPLSIVAVG